MKNPNLEHHAANIPEQGIMPHDVATAQFAGQIIAPQAVDVVLTEADGAELAADLDSVEAIHRQASQNLEQSEQNVEEIRSTLDVVTDAEIARRFECDGFVATPPRYKDQLTDKKRTKKFEIFDRNLERSPRSLTMTEREGLKELDAFITMFMNHSSRAQEHSPSVRDQVVQAQSIRDNLTFIGDKEYKEAVHGLGVRWKAYLDENPANKICIITGVGDLDRYKGKRKSDDYLKEQILTNFSDEELKKYSGRIVQRMHDVRKDDPSNVKAIILDDWTISGNQIRDVFRNNMNNDRFRELYEYGNVEINNITASKERIEDGFIIDPYQFNPKKRRTIPTFAYYQSHHAPDATTEANSHVSGLHAAVNYDFSNTIKEMQLMMKRGKVQLPGIASIIRDYRYKRSTISVKSSGIKRVKTNE